MSSPKYPRGSEWRKWDLQVHTPFSALGNGFGNDFDQYAKVLLQKAVEKNIAAIGMTDYFLIEGYKRLKKLVNDKEKFQTLVGAEIANKAQGVLLLPNIELRTSVIVTRPNGRDSRVNFHVIFCDDIDPSAIEEHFLREIKFTAESNPDGADERWSLTAANLENLGKKLKEQHEKFRERSDLYVGMMNAVVAHEDVTKVLDRQASRFKDRFLLVVPADEDLSQCSWDGQGHLTRKLFIQKSHMLFSGNPGTRAFCLGNKHPTVQDFKNEFKSLKPCIHGSDCHAYDTLFEPAERRYLWIKADPTFEGLRQLLHEPEGRVHFGDEPPFLSRVNEKATKYLSSVSFERTERAKQEEIWFSGNIPLNHGLVAVIGNKGSGKSALADILALLGDTHISDHFSFLNESRFLTPKLALGDMFRAKVSWHSGREITRLLSDPADNIGPEFIKYIPQNYLETICSELKVSHESQFDRELMDVIFSHVSEADKLGKEALPDLIDYLTNEKEQRISQVASELSEVNATIVVLEDQLAEEYRRSIEARLEQRRAELRAHDEAKPGEVKEPSTDPQNEAGSEVTKRELANLVEEVQHLDDEINRTRQQLRDAALQVAAADRLLARIDNLERQVQTFHTESVNDANALGLDTRNLITLSVNRQPILDAKTNAEERSRDANGALTADASGSLVRRRNEISEKTDATRSKLDEPNRQYQEYLHQLARWKLRRDEIAGSDENTDSVSGLQAKLAALDNLPDQIREYKKKRMQLVQEIFKIKEQLLGDYGRLYSPVQQFIDGHPVSQQQGALQFSASIAVDGFEDGLLLMIHQGRKGSFQGEQEGRELIREILKTSDFVNEAGVQTFLSMFQSYLEYDKRDANYKSVRLRDQLRQGRNPTDIYNFLYGLSYLKPRFELRWQGKPLDQLSPGERGNLLLVFYLLIDKRDVPLIIDQPEENLDNQTVATMLVPAIKHAKQHRQIVIVTHNPNLAVVCDAEQIIHSRLDKTDGHRVVYTTGAIEDPVITQLIVDVLEGTKPAFDLRDARYEVLDRSL
jgi:ABC-type lipoprotein export system ATPase subunit